MATPASVASSTGHPICKDETFSFCIRINREYVVPARSAYVLPDHVPSNRAILAANLETAINGLWDARPHVGDRVAVIGAGTVGCLVAWLASRIAGCDVQLVDVNPHRRAIATTLGVSFATPEQRGRER